MDNHLRDIDNNILKISSDDVIDPSSGNPITSMLGGGGGSVDVFNGLSSTSTTMALSAKQGNVLKSMVDAKQDAIADLEEIRSNASLGATALQEEQFKGTYSKPSGGIPKSDLASAVQTSLGKADTALQEHQDITGKADKATTLSGYGIGDAYTKSEVDTELGKKADKVLVNTTMPSGGFLPNVKYNLGVITGSRTFALATPTDEAIKNEYMFEFATGATPPTITWPSVRWGYNLYPLIEADKSYQVSIENGLAIIVEF